MAGRRLCSWLVCWPPRASARISDVALTVAQCWSARCAGCVFSATTLHHAPRVRATEGHRQLIHASMVTAAGRSQHHRSDGVITGAGRRHEELPRSPLSSRLGQACVGHL
mgnify:CR=1 FL=1